MKFCPQCGAAVVGEDPRFCAACGSSLPSLTGKSNQDPLRDAPSPPRLKTCFKCKIPFDSDLHERCPRCFIASSASGEPSQSMGRPSGLRVPRVKATDDGLTRVFHAFQVDTADAERDTDDIGIFESLPDAVLGLAQYVLFDMARDHSDWFLSGEIELPWGFPHEDEIDSMQLDWRRASSWLRRNSPDQLVDWYRRAHPDLELFVIPRLLCTASPSLEESVVMALRAGRYGLENLYLRRSENLLPRL